MKTRILLVPVVACLAITAAACGSDPGPRPAAPSSGVIVPPKPTAPQSRQGDLVTYRNGEPIGTEHWTDDGARLTTTVELAGKKSTVTIARRERHVHAEADGKVEDRDIPAGAIALENGSWQTLAIAADWFPKATEPTPVKVLMPGRPELIDAKIRVAPRKGGGRIVELTVASLDVSVELDPEGRVISGSAPSQEIEVRRAGEEAPARKSHVRAAPDNVTDEAIEVTRGAVTLRGSLWIPKSAHGPVPVALIIAGSGPTDRDGNSALGLRSDVYRLLAQELASRGIATLRYDKRGVGESSASFDINALKVDDMVDDAAAFVAKLHDPARFSKVTLIGHSEGGLLALLAPPATKVDAIVLVSTAGRPLRTVIREQLAARADAATMTEVDRLLGDVAAGRPLERVPPELTALFNPTIAAYLRSEIDLDPVKKLRAITIPTTVIQGDTDAQVGTADAKLLGAARKGVKVVVLPGVNHVLKAETSRTLPQASYTDPSRPIAPAAVDAIAAAVAR